MFCFVPTKVLLLAIIALQTANSAAIPLAGEVETFVSPDGYELAAQSYKEVEFEGHTVIVYNLPEPQSTNPDVKVKKDLLEKRDDHCGHSTFYNKSSGGSPLVNDCAAIQNYARSSPYTWRLGGVGPGDNWVRFYRIGTCVWGAKSANFFGARVGNDDAADLIRDSRNKFTWAGRLGAEGDMGCPTNVFPATQPPAKVLWAIFHS